MADGQGPVGAKEALRTKRKEKKEKKMKKQKKGRQEAHQEKRCAQAAAKDKYLDKGMDRSEQEKHRLRLHLRVKKLEAQARMFTVKAQQARAQAEYLDSLKAKEDEANGKTSLEAAAVDPEDSSSEEDAKQKKSKDREPREIVTDQAKEEEELGPSITDTDPHAEDKKEKKRQKREEKKAEKRKRKAEESGTHEAPGDDAMDVDVAEEAETPQKKKKKRKTEDTAEEITAQEAVSEAETPKEKNKKDKKEKKVKKDKKEKKNKEREAPNSAKEHEPDHEPEPVPAPVPTPEPAADGGEQWNASALEGGDKRKAKFLRLLGANKSNGAAAAAGSHASPAPSSKTDIARVQSDLERQFNSGVKMKNEGQGRRRGLGA